MRGLGPVVNWAWVFPGGRRGQALGGESGVGSASPRGSGLGEEAGRRPACGLLPDGARRLCQKAQEDGAPAGVRGKFGHVADAIGEGDGGGPTSEQGPEPLRRLASRVVVVEG